MKMAIQKFFKKIKFYRTLGIIICILLIPIIYFCLNIFNPFIFGSKSMVLEIDNAVLNGCSLENDMFVSISDDASIVFNNINTKVQNISINLISSGKEEYTTQVYFDVGNGINENDSVFYNLHNGLNIININNNSNVFTLRIDPSLEKADSFNFGDIKINDKTFNFSTLWCIPFFIIFALIFMKNLNLSCMAYMVMLYILYTYIYRYENIKIGVLLFTVIAFGCLFIKKWDEEEEIASEKK